MKLKDIGPKIIFVLFITIICISLSWWIISENYTKSENHENRTLHQRPHFTLDNYTSFASDYTAYYNDALPFRNNLILLNNAIDYFVFNRSSNPNVIIGNDNWLFYNNPEDGDPISCYMGTNMYTDSELNQIATNCIRQRDILRDQGIEFVIFIAPNKERIYSEYMPKHYGRPASNYSILQIVNYLKKNTDIRIIYPYDELIKAKSELGYNIYSKTDTHWNYIGAYVGSAALMKEFGIEMPPISSSEISIIKGENSSGDLANMLNLGEQLRYADRSYSIVGYDTHNLEITNYEFNEAISYHSFNADPRKIYVIRDSFATHMLPYIGSQFDNSYLRHINTYSYDDLISQSPDIVVYETVERYADNLINFSISD